MYFSVKSNLLAAPLAIKHTDEWKNFLQRVKCNNEEELKGSDDLEEELRLWASYRGQTLTRTGMPLSV